MNTLPSVLRSELAEYTGYPEILNRRYPTIFSTRGNENYRERSADTLGLESSARGFINNIKWMQYCGYLIVDQRCSSAAAQHGQVETLRYLFKKFSRPENLYSRTKCLLKIVETAARCDQVAALRYALEENQRQTRQSGDNKTYYLFTNACYVAMISAAKSGALECLKLAKICLDSTISLERVLSAALLNDHNDCIKVIHTWMAADDIREGYLSALCDAINNDDERAARNVYNRYVISYYSADYDMRDVEDHLLELEDSYLRETVKDWISHTRIFGSER